MKIIRTFLLVFTFFLIFASAAFAQTGNTYYVDGANGNDSFPGTQTSPWKTIQKAADNMNAGDTVNVLAGNYPERVKVSKSGGAGIPIVFQAQGTVVTKGFELVNIVQNPYRMLSVDYIVIRGFEIANTDYVRWHTEVSSGIYIKGGNNLVENNYIHDATLEGIELYGVPGDATSTHDNVVRNNRLFHNEMVGININGRNNLVEGNEVWDSVQCHPALMAVEDTKTDNNGAKCPNYPAVSGLDADGLRFFGQGHIIRKNYIHDIKFGPPGINPVIGDFNDNPHIDCFQTWAGTYNETATNITFEQNTCNELVSQAANENGSGFMLAGGANNLYIRNNIMKTYGGVNTGGTGGADHLYIYNNLWINNLAFNQFYPNAISLQSAPYSIVKNNIFYDQPYHTIVAVGDTTGVDIDYNLAFNNGTGCMLGSCPDCFRFGTYTCINPPPAHDIWKVDPQFVNPSSDDYHLQSTSPVIDKGLTISSVSDDYDGVSRPQGVGYDIGPFEFQTSPTLTSTPTIAIGNGDVNGDGIVDSKDILAILQNYGKNIGLPTDQYGDSIINMLDFNVIVENYPTQIPSPTLTVLAAPTNLTASVISSSQVNLLWDPLTNYNVISGYKIFRNGVNIVTVLGGLTNTFSDNNLSANTLYSYQIKAVDFNGNISPFNQKTVSITTPSTRTNPMIFYISTAGNDSNPGTIDQPWQTIQKALNTLVAGDTLYIRGGVYQTIFGGWTFKNSGTSTQPITVNNYPGEQVILKLPADPGPYSPNSSTSDYSVFRCWSTADWLTTKADYINIKGTDVNPVTLSNGIKSIKGIVVQGPDPGIGYNTSVAIRISDCDYWEIAGIDFVDVGYGIFTYVRNYQTMANRSADHWYVHDNRVYGFWRESGLQFDGPYNRVENNEIYKVVNDAYTPYGCQGLNFLSHHNIIKGNIISKMGSTYQCTGLLFEWDLADFNIVEGNKIYDNDIGFNLEGGDNNIIRNNVIYQKTIFNQWAGGIQINSFDNTSYTSWPCDEEKPGGSSLSILPANDPKHPDYQYYYNPRNCHSWGNQIYNNTINGYGVGIKFYQLFPENTIVRNNVTAGWKFGGVCFYEASTGHCLPFPSGANVDHNVDNGNFAFKDPANYDFHLIAGSALIDSGYDLGSLVTDDFDGVIRPQGSGFDIGAYEYH